MALEREMVLIRMPASLKEVLTEQAGASLRSFNAEVLTRLWSTLGESPAERLAVVEGMRADSGAAKGPQLALGLGARKGPKSARSKPATSKRKAVKRG